MIEIARTNLNFEREPMAAPFGFKGGYVHEGWQTVARMESAGGKRGIGLATQGVLWSDGTTAARNTEAAGNSMMLLTTAHALHRAQGFSFRTPPDLLDHLLPETYAYAKRITENPDLRLTFALNALVAVDNAAWMLYAAEQGITRFDDIIPADARAALAHRHRQVLNIPLISYGKPIEEVVRLVKEGYYLLKIKMGADPDKDGDQEKMLQADKERLSAIHAACRQLEGVGGETGHVLYYLDANGRYETKERLLRLLDYAVQIGALPWTVLLEEPFPESLLCDVRDIPVRTAADESAHSDREALGRMEAGYGAIALKPIAKTLSMSFRIAKLAHERGVSCFCADLTVNPILVDWNKSMAARLAPLPGMNIGVVEANGFQNYRNWVQMETYHPCAGASWMQPKNGIYELDADFYARSGGIFMPSRHYEALTA